MIFSCSQVPQDAPVDESHAALAQVSTILYNSTCFVM